MKIFFKINKLFNYQKFNFVRKINSGKVSNLSKLNNGTLNNPNEQLAKIGMNKEKIEKFVNIYNLLDLARIHYEKRKSYKANRKN